MRISVRASANVQKRNPPTEFSRASRERPRTARKRAALRDRLLNSAYPKPSRSATEFQGLGPSSRKKTLPGVLDSFFGLYRVTATVSTRIVSHGRSRSSVPELGPDSLSP